jgi:hypothetical protein
MPIYFTGEWGKVNTFLQMFNYFRNANHQNEVMTSPFQRAHLLLMFMRGPKVEQWAARKGEELTLVVLGDPDNNVLPTHQKNNEGLWTALLTALQTAYLEYHGVEGAYRVIKDLWQKEGHVDDYIVKFENLLSKAEWGWDQHETIAAFKEGLVQGLLIACIKQWPPPVTLTEWEDVAWDKEQSFYQLKFDLAEAQKHRSGKCLGDMARDAGKHDKRPAHDMDPRPYYPMQLDAVKTQRLTDEEWTKLLREKKCFYCKEAGHRYKDCKEQPKDNKKGKGKKGRRFKQWAWATSMPSTSGEESNNEEEEKDKEKEALPAYTKKNLMTAIKKMTVKEWEDLLDSMALDSDQDFWNAQCHQPGCGQYVCAECTWNEWILSTYVSQYRLHVQWPSKLLS